MDAKENSGAHQLVECGSMPGLEAWWHVAVKNRATGFPVPEAEMTLRSRCARNSRSSPLDIGNLLYTAQGKPRVAMMTGPR